MITAVSMVRDEQDIVGHTIEHLLAHGIDRLIIADNLSQDDTPLILERYPQVSVVSDTNPAYEQADKMTNLARMAFDEGAHWVVPFDADEIFYPAQGTLASFLHEQAADIVEILVWDHIATNADPVSGNPFERMTTRRTQPQGMPKVCFRAHPDAELHMGNHDVNRPGARARGLFGRHFGYRSLDQLKHKVRVGREACECSDMHPRYCGHWREMGAMNDDQLFERWQWFCSGRDPWTGEQFETTVDPAPWRHL